MAETDAVIRHLRRAVLRQDAAARTDGQLLASFIDRGDDDAFEALVRRHGRMVFAVCRRVVRDYQDAEDAFQATFLVLARKAASVRPRECVANWLHGVALRTAMKAKSITAKRRSREKQVTEMREPESTRQDHWRDVLPLLDIELNALPENYRLPIVLCDLEGKTIREATRQLGWPQGTLAGRLARGRKLLARRMANRGVGLSAGALAAVVSQNAASAVLPTSLINSTVKAQAMLAAGQATIAGVVSAKVAALTGGVLKAMLLSKLKSPTVGLLLVALLCGTAGAIYRTQAAEPPKTGQKNKPTATMPADDVRTLSGTTRDELDGDWTVVSVVDDRKNNLEFDPIFSYAAGTQAPVRNARLTLGKGAFTLKTGLVSLNGGYVSDSSMTPKGISISVHPSVGSVLSLPGIYTLDGDNLTITLSRVPASQVAGLAGKPPGVCYTLRREAPPKDEPKNDPRSDASKPQVSPSPPHADVRRGYVVTAELVEAGTDEPTQMPKMTVDDGQPRMLVIPDGPQNLLDKAVQEENLTIGSVFEVRVRRLWGNKVRLFFSFQKNETEKAHISEIRVLGKSVQTLQDVELRKPLKLVYQKDADGTAQRWVEVTVEEISANEQAVPAPAATGPQQIGIKY